MLWATNSVSVSRFGALTAQTSGLPESWTALDPQGSSTADRCDATDEVARFALNLSGRLRATRDVYGAEAMMLAMEPMRSLMIKEQL